MHNSKASEQAARERKKNERRKNGGKPAVQRKHFPPPKEPPRREVLPRIARQYGMSNMEAATLLGAGLGLRAIGPFGTAVSVVDQVSEMLNDSFLADHRRDDGMIVLSAPDVVEAQPDSFRALVDELKKR